MFLFPKKKKKKIHWELKCQHSSQQLANNEIQLSRNQEPLNKFSASDKRMLWQDKLSGNWGPHGYEGRQMEHFTTGNTLTVGSLSHAWSC
jgi:hypothetical protein